ncbi:MAG: protein TolQ [bacterium]|nr:protein TolQ [bacterium]
MLDLIFGASPVVTGVLFALVLASIASWAIILMKIGELRRVDGATRIFLEAYHNKPLDAVYEIARKRKASPLALVFKAGFDEVVELEKEQGSSELIEREQLERVIRRMYWIRDDQSQRLERGLSFLATVGSSAPFVGLFGTVIGIMNSFQQIGTTGSASLAVVAPGIAEALIATAVGLFAAIPAVIAYNYSNARVSNILTRLDTFCREFGDLLRGSAVR